MSEKLYLALLESTKIRPPYVKQKLLNVALASTFAFESWPT